MSETVQILIPEELKYQPFNQSCNHVWHEFTRYEHTGGQSVVRKCMHCGRVHHDHFPPPVNRL